ncbi:MAG: hypothetical protein AAF639_40075 [Chloroflexota bacterium]
MHSLVGLYMLMTSWLIQGCSPLIHSESLLFDFRAEASTHDFFEFQPLLIQNQDDISPYLHYLYGNQALAFDIDYNHSFILVHFWAIINPAEEPNKRELALVERSINTISLYYDYSAPNTEATEDIEVILMDIITIEKHDSFVWEGEVEVILYYNESE